MSVIETKYLTKKLDGLKAVDKAIIKVVQEDAYGIRGLSGH